MYLAAVLRRNKAPDLPIFASRRQRLKVSLISLKIKLVHKRPPVKRALVCPPTGESGSLGDQAMIQALVDQLKALGFLVDMVVANKSVGYDSINGLDSIVGIEYYQNDLRYMYALSDYCAFYLIGADVLDGFYDELPAQWLLWLAYVAARSCRKVTIAGFSFNKRPATGCVAIFRILPRKIRICCRDKDSLKRFRKYVGKLAVEVADLAFLLNPDGIYPQFMKHVEWVERTRKRGGKILGLNLSAHSFDAIKSLSRERILNHFTSEITKVLANDASVSIMLIPHDIREVSGDIAMLKDLYTKITSTQDKKRIRLVQQPMTAAAIKSLVSHLDAVLSGRMHLAIACLGVSTPVACITYQDKFEGLFDSYGLRGLLLTPDAALKSGVIYEKLFYLLDHRGSIRNAIKSHQPHVKELATLNLSGLN